VHGAEPAASATPSCSRPRSMIFSGIGNILRLPRRAQWSSPPEASSRERVTLQFTGVDAGMP
jgi:hypothetical protein